VGYSQSQQVFKVFSFGLYKGPESFSPLVDCFVDNRLFKQSTVPTRLPSLPRKLQVVLNRIKLVTCKCR